MGRKPQLSAAVRSNLLLLSEEGYSQRQISKRLNISVASVNKFLKLKNAGESLEPKKRTGRRRKTSSKTDKQIKRLVTQQPFLTAAQVKAELPGILDDVSNRTIRNRLHSELGFKARRPVHKPLLTEKMRKKRLQFCRNHADWTAEKWSTVMFSDESMFRQFGNFNTTVRRPSGSSAYSPQYVVPTVKHAPSVMVWGAFSAKGQAGLFFLEKNTTMNADCYINVLDNHLLQFMEIQGCAIFQQDGAPAHKAKKVGEWLRGHNITLLDWPGNSPDLNPIENLWAVMKKKVAEKNCSSMEELKSQLKMTWVTDISVELCQNLAMSMPRRIKAVLDNKGYNTKY